MKNQLNSNSQISLMNDVEKVVADENKFKIKLRIGENAYTSLRTINKLREIWDVLGAVGGGTALATSPIFASTFFAPTGLLGLLGIGTAVTPIGWVAFMGLASGGACYGFYRLLGNTKDKRVIEIPRYLNTPLDTLGLALFDLLAPLSLRIATTEEQIGHQEKECLIHHLCDEWGLDKNFVTQAIKAIENDAANASIEIITKELTEFLHSNPDCNHDEISKDIIYFLEEMLQSSDTISADKITNLNIAKEILINSPATEWSKQWVKIKDTANDATQVITNGMIDAFRWTREKTRFNENLNKK